MVTVTDGSSSIRHIGMFRTAGNRQRVISAVMRFDADTEYKPAHKKAAPTRRSLTTRSEKPSQFSQFVEQNLVDQSCDVLLQTTDICAGTTAAIEVVTQG